MSICQQLTGCTGVDNCCVKFQFAAIFAVFNTRISNFPITYVDSENDMDGLPLQSCI